jgi:vitamin B12 transporter
MTNNTSRALFRRAWKDTDMNRHILAVLATTAIFTHPALAQEAYDLDAIIVSGGLTPIAAEKYGRSATVLTADEIKKRGLNTVQDALRAVPGVSVSGSGGSFTQVRIRGAEANHTLILIDGVEAAGGDGEYILSGLDTANIERIEVLRGPQSVFYGANASAGVINIITRTGGIGQEYGASFEVGSHGSTNATGFASTRSGRGGLSLSFSDYRDAGWDFSGEGGERDSTHRYGVTLKGDLKVMDSLKLGFNLRHSKEDNDLDSISFVAVDADGYVVDDPTQISTREEMTLSLFGEHEMLEGRLLQRLAFELTDNDRTSNGGPKTRTKTEAYKYRLSFGLDGTAAADADHLLNFLAEHEQDSSSTNPLFERKTNSLALEYRGSFDNGLDIQLGARFDDNNVFKDATTWNLGASYTFAGSGVRLHASAGTGVVNPSYFELFAASFGFTGNPNLRPERNESFDVGIEVPVMAGRGSIDVTYFNEKLRDEITSISTGPGTFSFINQSGNSTREGFEVEGQLAASDAIDLRLFYTYLDAKNPDGSTEIRRPKHELGLGITAQTFGGRGSVTADLRYVADNTDTQFFGTFTPAKLPDYAVVDLSARYAVTEHVDATLRIDNLFDKTYSDVWGYATRDRTISVGFDANW